MADEQSWDWTRRTVGVTGAGGFIGHRLLKRFEELGADLRGLDLAPEGAERARETGAEVIVGDTRRRSDVEALCDGCDVVIHTAAIVGEGGDLERYRSVNVDGTASVVRAAMESAVAQFVHLSSVMVYGFDYPPDVGEDGPLRGEGNAYCQTKIESEEVARRADGDLAVTVVRPGDVYGPRSEPWVVRPLELMKRRLFILPDGGQGILDPTYVENLVDAIVLLVEQDATGVYNVTDGRPVTTREFFEYHSDMLGGTWIPTAPAGLLRGLFAGVGAGFRALGQDPPASPSAVDFLDKPHGYSTEKIREAGHEPRVSLEEGMERTRRWAAASGLLD